MEIYIAKSGKETGPFTKEQIPAMLESGMVMLTDSVWHEGLAGWIPIHQFLNVRPPIPRELPSASDKSRKWFDLILPDARSGDPAPALLRLGAAIIDLIAVVVALFVIEFLLRLAFFPELWTPDEVVEKIMTLVALWAWWMYYAIMESTSSQGTLGKLTCGLVVTELKGDSIGFARATGRFFAKFVSVFTFGIGFLMCTWTDRKQCLHDIMARCVVVMK
jgi:uncharacterized RDD family membrane protein YckC